MGHVTSLTTLKCLKVLYKGKGGPSSRRGKGVLGERARSIGRVLPSTYQGVLRSKKTLLTRSQPLPNREHGVVGK